jgi:hypothetical protein
MDYEFFKTYENYIYAYDILTFSIYQNEYYK